MPLRAADFESAAYAIPPLRAGPKCRRACAAGTPDRAAASRPGPMLDSPGLRIAVRRDPPIVEDLRSTTVSDDPVQRRDLILLEQAREGGLDAFNDLVTLYQDQLFALVVRMVPDRDQASDCVQEAFFSAYRNLRSFRGGSVKSWLNRICVNAAMDTQRARKRRPVQPYPELDDESWQPPTGPEADPERTAMLVGAHPGPVGGARDDHRRPADRDRPLRHRGLRLRRDRRDDRRLAGDREVADPSRPAGAPRAPPGPHGAVPWLTSTPPTTSMRSRSLLDGDLLPADRATAARAGRALSRMCGAPPGAPGPVRGDRGAPGARAHPRLPPDGRRRGPPRRDAAGTRRVLRPSCR